MPNKNIIEAEDLVFSYSDDDAISSENGVAAVNGISIDIERASFTAIIGHNGSGKSTLAKLLSGVYEPSGGNVKIFRACDEKALDCSKEEDNFEIRKTVGMVFQNPDNQLVASIVEDDVAFAPENLGVEPLQIRKRVDDALETVGLSEFATHDTHKLSGGQKQRVAIAGILAMNPECIIFDESTAMLDPLGRRDVIRIMERLNREEGLTVINITHYMEEAARADRVIVINDGEIAYDGTAKEVFHNVGELHEMGLEAPQGRELIYRLRSLGYDIDDTALSEEECVDALLKYLKDNVNEYN